MRTQQVLLVVFLFAYVLLVTGANRIPFRPPTEEGKVYTADWVVNLNDGTLPEDIADLGFEIIKPIEGISSTYVVRHKETHARSGTHNSRASRAVTSLLVSHPGVKWAEQQEKVKFTPFQSAPNDPLYSDSWHISNTGSINTAVAGMDLNVLPAWAAGYDGRGKVVTVIDDGYEYTHPELADSYIANISRNYNGGQFGRNDPAPNVTVNFHGTTCAGIILSKRNNSKCGVGIAYASRGAGIRTLGGDGALYSDYAEAYTFSRQITDVYSNSYGVDTKGSTVAPIPQIIILAYEACMKGRNGKGNIFVYSAGNSAREGSNANDKGMQAHRFGIVVGAIGVDGKKTAYSEQGANLLVTGPGGSVAAGMPGGIRSADILGETGYSTDDCTSAFTGTSASCPTIAGVALLLLQANENLGWRDVQYLLATTTRKNDPTDSDWATNGAGYHVNHKYGFGLPDTFAAINASLTHVNFPVELVRSASSSSRRAIPDYDTTGITIDVNIEDDFFVESAVLTFVVDHANANEVKVEITSPAGTNSVLANKRSVNPCIIVNTSLATTGYANYGALTNAMAPLSGPVAKIDLVNPGSYACNSVTRCSELPGKIAYVTVPYCTDYGVLTTTVQNCGAIGLIVGEIDTDTPDDMYVLTTALTGAALANITIPSLDLSENLQLAFNLQEGQQVTLTARTTPGNLYSSGWYATSKRVLGERSKGTWKIKFSDLWFNVAGTVTSVRLDVYGHDDGKGVVGTTGTTAAGQSTTSNNDSTSALSFVSYFLYFVTCFLLLA